jgi:DNA polymerase IV
MNHAEATFERQILHVDMDAFFASVEELYDPSLKGKPVLVGFDGPRSVVCAASYAARKFGCRSAMAMSTAKRLCPQAIIVPVHRDRYVQASAAVFAIFGRYTPLIEGLSLDEAFLDVSASGSLFGSGEHIATAIRAAIRKELGLAASAGIATTKFAAKLASDHNKPDGQFKVPDDVPRFLAPLPIARMWGVGPKSLERFLALGIRCFGDLQRAEESWLRRALGPHALRLRELAWGLDAREVIAGGDAKSISSESTYVTDVTEHDAVVRAVLHHACEVAERLSSQDLEATTIGIRVKYPDFSSATRQHSVQEPLRDSQSIFEIARALLPKVFADGEAVRLVGVSASGLQRTAQQASLFENATRAKRNTLDAVRHAIAAKTGAAVTRADLLQAPTAAAGNREGYEGARGPRRAPEVRSQEQQRPAFEPEGGDDAGAGSWDT